MTTRIMIGVEWCRVGLFVRYLYIERGILVAVVWEAVEEL